MNQNSWSYDWMIHLKIDIIIEKSQMSRNCHVLSVKIALSVQIQITPLQGLDLSIGEWRKKRGFLILN